jgi:hypothetical protein
MNNLLRWQKPNDIHKALNMKNIAVVGLSSNRRRDSNMVGNYLLENGYRVTPVNPNENKIFGLKSFPNLSDIPNQIDVVNVFRDSSAIPAIAQAAVSIGAKYLWLQYGVVNLAGIAIAERAGVTCIVDKCMKVEHESYLVQ